MYLIPVLAELSSLRLPNYSIQHRLSPIISYLDAQLFVLMQHLDLASRQTALVATWMICAADMYAIARKSHDSGDYASVKVIGEALEYFMTYFCGRGKGLNRNMLEKSAGKLRGFFVMGGMPTDALIGLHESLVHFCVNKDDLNRVNEFGCSCGGIVDILKRRVSKSRDAKRYIEKMEMNMNRKEEVSAFETIKRFF